MLDREWIHALIFACCVAVFIPKKITKSVLTKGLGVAAVMCSVLAPSALGSTVGLYSWEHTIWRDPSSRFFTFFESPEGRTFRDGDLYVNVADHVFPRDIPDLDKLLQFMQRIRSLGNRQIIYVTYGDKNGASTKAFAEPSIFVDAFFAWITSLSPDVIQSILPIGISFDCERFPSHIVKDTLLYAQAVKLRYLDSHFSSSPESLSIQWVIEGKLDPFVSDAVMRFADSALMMVYRNYLLFSPSDPGGRSGLANRLRNYFLIHQCPGCLLDDYASSNYRAKISIMVEASCVVDDECSLVSFCAKNRIADFEAAGSPAATSPVDYLVSTLQGLERFIDSALSPTQRNRLFASPNSLFVIHNFEWFSCYFQNESLSFNPQLCLRFPDAANSCRGDDRIIIQPPPRIATTTIGSS